MIFWDFEVTKYNWLTVILNMDTGEETDIVDDQEKMIEFYDEHKSEIWVGFNNHHYDDYILKGILCGFDPYEINEHIITKGKDGWTFSNLFRKIPLLSYDVYQNKIDRGLKYFEGSLGNMIKESSIDFRIDRPLTRSEIDEMLTYCRHDVEQTVEVFLQRKNDFDAILSLIKMFPETLSIEDIGLTKAQISAKILECERTTRDDEFDLFVLPSIKIQKYRKAIDFYMGFSGTKLSPEYVYSQSLTMMIAGLEHNISWGGIHAGKEKYRNLGEGRQIWHVDVASFYPRLMIFHGLLTRNSREPEKFKQIYDRRIELKHAGKKKEQAPLKIVINGTYGISKSKTSTAYDPRNANLICLNGQLMLIDLIEKLEVINGFELIQSNTDGLIVSLPDTDEAFEQMDDICFEWESRNNMVLEFDEISKIWEKDVNNYVFQFASGKLERKGSYLKEIGSLDHDLYIVNKAIVDKIVHDIPVETTINACDDLREFQMVKKIGSGYSHILFGGHWEDYHFVNPRTGKLNKGKRFAGDPKRLSEKCIRVFASTDPRTEGVWKVKIVNGKDKIEKIDGTPEHCILWNDEVNGQKIPKNLDRKFYIDMAKDRLNQFGVTT